MGNYLLPRYTATKQIALLGSSGFSHHHERFPRCYLHTHLTLLAGGSNNDFILFSLLQISPFSHLLSLCLWLTPSVMVTPTRSTLTTAVFLQLFRNNSTILINRPFTSALRDPTLTCPGIATDILLPEHHGSVTSHKQGFAFSTSSGVRGVRGDCQGRPCHGWSRRDTLDAHRDTVSMENCPRGRG